MMQTSALPSREPAAGRQLIQAALALEGVQLGAALEREGSSLLGSDAGELAGAGKQALPCKAASIR